VCIGILIVKVSSLGGSIFDKQSKEIIERKSQRYTKCLAPLRVCSNKSTAKAQPYAFAAIRKYTKKQK